MRERQNLHALDPDYNRGVCNSTLEILALRNNGIGDEGAAFGGEAAFGGVAGTDAVVDTAAGARHMLYHIQG